MNWLDVAIALLIVTSLISSVINGLTRELVSLAALVLGILMALWFYPEPARYLEPYTSSPAVAGFVGFFVILIAFLILGWAVSKLLSALVKAAGLRWFDRVLGAAFGLVRGLLAGAALVLAIVAFLPGNGPAESVAHSRLAPTALFCARTIVAVAPRRLKENFEDGLQRVRQIWRSAAADSP